MEASDPADALRILVNPHADPRHARSIFDILNSYASDPNGGATPLDPSLLPDLIEGLSERPWITTLLAHVGDQPAGLLVAVEGFSTFSARPLMNLHDVAVHPDFRGRGIGSRLLAEIERIARERGCCKLTLEVLVGNDGARRLYDRLGFRPYVLDLEMGSAQFWEKRLRD